MRKGDLRRVTVGEFEGRIVRIGGDMQGDPAEPSPNDLILLQMQDKEGRYQDFITVARTVVEQTTVATVCPDRHYHHVGDCCLTCGNDERGIQTGDSSHLTPEDRERFAKKDAVFKANWEDF